MMKRRNRIVLTLLAGLTLGSFQAAAVEPCFQLPPPFGQDCLSNLAAVREVQAERGLGVIRVVLSREVFDPARCGSGLLPRSAVLDVSLRTTPPAEDVEAEKRRPGEGEEEIPDAEQLEREEIRLLTDSLYLAAINAYPIRVVVDGQECSSARGPARPVIKGIVVSP